MIVLLLLPTIAGENAGCLLAQELPPARPERLGAGRKTIGKQDPSDTARRHAQAIRAGAAAGGDRMARLFITSPADDRGRAAKLWG